MPYIPVYFSHCRNHESSFITWPLIPISILISPNLEQSFTPSFSLKSFQCTLWNSWYFINLIPGNLKFFFKCFLHFPALTKTSLPCGYCIPCSLQKGDFFFFLLFPVNLEGGVDILLCFFLVVPNQYYLLPLKKKSLLLCSSCHMATSYHRPPPLFQSCTDTKISPSHSMKI